MRNNSARDGTSRIDSALFWALAAALSCSAAAAEVAAPDDSVAAWLARASVERKAGDWRAEVSALVHVLDIDAAHPVAHARLAAISGPAPRQGRPEPEALIRRANAHPYDPGALLLGGRALVESNRLEEAFEFLEKVVWLADLDPTAALDALLVLRELSPDWRARRVVPIHLYADAAIRMHEGWRFALRTAWLSSSNSLDEVLQTRFVPIVIDAFDRDVPVNGRAKNNLDAMYREFVAKVSPPEEGILALMTGRLVPSTTGVWKKGVAEFLGRSLAIRITPGASQSRVLSHELLHLYGAIHVLDDVASLMNPTGTTLALDPGSYRIARATVGRSFARGGIDRNVLPFVELRRVTDAYVDALSLNLMSRNAGITEAQSHVAVSRKRAVERAHEATLLDPHFADTARIVAVLMLADSRRAEALRLLELATKLYGAESVKGIEAARDAAALRGAIEAAQ